MQYAFCSLKPVVGSVIRNTGIQEADWIASIHEWLWEAILLMQTDYTLEGFHQDLPIQFHKAPLPCGLVQLDAVACEGHRLMEGRADRPADANHSDRPVDPTDPMLFVSVVNKVPTVENHSAYITTIQAINNLPCGPDYYYTQAGVLNTSMRQAIVRIYAQRIPTDTDNMPLIPDNQNYKMALYWYVRSMMIGAGWEDKVFRFDHCWAQWEVFAPRARNEIRQATPSMLEATRNALNRLLPMEGYFQSFFTPVAREGKYL